MLRLLVAMKYNEDEKRDKLLSKGPGIKKKGVWNGH